MLTIEQCRQSLGEDGINLSDKQVEEVRDFLYSICHIVINRYKEKGPDIFKFESKEKIEQVVSSNKERHKLNKLRPFATIDEKVKWHIDHIANCKCGHMPIYIKKEIEKRMK